MLVVSTTVDVIEEDSICVFDGTGFDPMDSWVVEGAVNVDDEIERDEIEELLCGSAGREANIGVV